MTEAEIVALIVAIPPTLLALGTLIVGIRNSRKADIITKDVNSGAKAARDEITQLRSEVASLLADKAERKQVAALLAQALVEKAESKG